MQWFFPLIAYTDLAFNLLINKIRMHRLWESGDEMSENWEASLEK